MFVVEVQDTFSAAHNLRNYEGKCEKLHGHNWLVRVYVCGEKLDESGMLIDFKVLKGKLKEVLNYLDHSYLNEIEPFDRVNPSSENIAYFIFQKLKELLRDYPVRVLKVTVYESHGNGATYQED